MPIGQLALFTDQTEIEHIIPTAKGGADAEDNLWLARRICNNAKRAQTLARNPITKRIVRLFDPRRQDWSRHFTWSEDGTLIIGKTACGALPLWHCN